MLVEQLLSRSVGCLTDLTLPSESPELASLLAHHMKFVDVRPAAGRRRPPPAGSAALAQAGARGGGGGGGGGGGEDDTDDDGDGDGDGDGDADGSVAAAAAAEQLDASGSKLDDEAEVVWSAHLAHQAKASAAESIGINPPNREEAEAPAPAQADAAAARAGAGARTAPPVSGPGAQGPGAQGPGAQGPPVSGGAPEVERLGLCAFLRRHLLQSPTPAVRQLLADVEASVGAAIRRAEAAANRHPPFLAALSDEGSKDLGGAPSVRTLDVGCIRVDASGLWPDETREMDLAPFFAPMALDAQLSGYGGEVPPVPVVPNVPSRPKPGKDSLQSILAFVAASTASRTAHT